LLSEEFLESASRDQKGLLQRSFVKQVLLDATLPPPIRFDKLSSNDIQLFVASLKKKDGSAVGSSTHNTTRSAVRDLFRTYNQMELVEKMGSSLGQFFRGLKRSTAQQQGKGEGGKIQVGQYDRYTKTFNALLSDDPEVVAELQRRGLKPDDLGSHSARKGATTFASSGSTACPPQAAINLRGGWSMPGVQSTYVRYEAAGDQFCGRTLAGLPNDRPEFAILPPHFEHNQEAILAECFPGAPASLFRVLEFALASVVFHRQYLRDILPAKHRLFQTPLFTRPVVLEELAADVICGIASAGFSRNCA